jgi:bacillithiol biosynthesis cysteine-adding enzyme BshC
VSVAPGPSRLFADFCSGALEGFLPPRAEALARPPMPAHWPELVRLLAAQNSSSSAASSLKILAQGGGAVLTGQQVGLFGGPLYTPLKAATAIARARAATAEGRPHAAVFWLATEDHDFAEISRVVFPAGRELEALTYSAAPARALPVGNLVLDGSIAPLAARAAELLGPSEATEALVAAYRPGRTLAQAFADFYASIFAAQGLLIVNADSREFHRLGASVLGAAIEQADEFHAALVERNQQLKAAGYHAQVAVEPQSSLLFLIDEATGARLALHRSAPTAAEAQGLWFTTSPEGKPGRVRYSTAELMGILASAPERISPAALLRPVFQDFLFSTSMIVGGPAEIAYYAQSAVLYERILGRQTPPEPRFSATLVEPSMADLLGRYALTLEEIFAAGNAAALAQKLAARALPAEAKKKLDAADGALDAELDALTGWMREQDKGLGESATTAAKKMRYQMGRLRRLAANFQLQREATLGRHAGALVNALYPGGALQERTHGAAYYFARYGLDLAEIFCQQAASVRNGHAAIWM